MGLNTRTNHPRAGFLYGLAAYGWWGLVPLYFRWVGDNVTAWEMLAHRVVWSMLFLAVVLTAGRRWADAAACFRNGRLLGPLTVSSVLLGVNWVVYIYSVHARLIVQASLGYYITPLASVLIGLLVL